MTYCPLDKVTRVEIIDQDGRSYVNWNGNNKVELSFQDDKRTLKVFISRVNPDEREPHSLITKTLKNHYDELEVLIDKVIDKDEKIKQLEQYNQELIEELAGEDL